MIGLGDDPQPSEIITAAGWGKTESAPTDALRDVDIQVGACPDFALTMVCAGDVVAGASSGDSGGPGFVRSPDGTMRQIGISSGLNGDAQSMYTNLAVPEPWDTIRDDLTAAGFEALIPK